MSIQQNPKEVHYHVLRDIAKITDSKSGLSEESTELNFELIDSTLSRSIDKWKNQKEFSSKQGCKLHWVVEVGVAACPERGLIN